jgi:transcription antitermination factor NusG
MWKILAVIAAVLLVGASYFSWQNRALLDKNRKDLSKEKDTLVARQKDLSDAKEQIVSYNQSIMALQDETEKLATQKIDFDNKVVQADSELKLLETQVKVAVEKLDRARLLIKDFPDIESIRRQMAETRTEIEETEILKVKKEAELEQNDKEIEQLAKVAAELVALKKDQEAGVIRGDFESTVAKAYNKWGFVVVNGGNDQGVVHNAQLDVYRRGNFLCKLLVTQVEAAQAVADIIPGSLMVGQSVLPGDIVVKAVKTTTLAVPLPPGTTQGPAPTPDNGAPAPQPGAQPGAADPFGGAPATPPPAMEPDPFGGAPATPPAAMEPDPFGAPPATPPKPAEPNPFQ